MDCYNCGRSNVILTCPDCGAKQHIPLGLPAPSKRSKRLPVLILCAMFIAGLLLFYLVPMGGSQQEHFVVADGVLYFYEEYYHGGPVLTVPEKVGDKTVRSLSVGCFENNTTLTTILLPDTLTEIRERAFAGCSELRGMDLPESVESIGAGAFRDCVSLESVYMPGGISFIGTDAFSGCSTMLYLFYNGMYQNLYQLYPQEINPYTWAICLDGEYPYMEN